MPKLLFICTGNYYRSRFAELYFRHLAGRHDLGWQVDSRGLHLTPSNKGPLSQLTLQECEKLGVPIESPRLPIALQEDDLLEARLAIAVKESEHRLLMREKFPCWEDRIEYWKIHDLDAAPACETLPQLRDQVLLLVQRLHE